MGVYRKKIFENLALFHIWLPLVRPRGWQCPKISLTISFILEMLQTKKINNWPSSFQEEVKREKLLTGNARRTTTDVDPSCDDRSPE